MADFSDQIIERVWEKANIDPNNDPNVFRKDYAGAWIRRQDYGQTTRYGWEIDHLRPLAHGGTDELSNLLPLHWENNREKGDHYPSWSTMMTSVNNQNVERHQNWYVDNG